MTSLPVVAVFGTSIDEGFSGSNHESAALQALTAASLPFVGMGKGSETTTILLGATHHRARYALAAMATDVICGHGVNDGLNSGATTFSSLAGKLQLMWAQLRSFGPGGRRVWQLTLPPSYNTSTDGWATVTGQTVSAGNAARVLVNDWIRAGAPQDSGGNPVTPGTAGSVACPNLFGFFETADGCETARNSGKWPASGRVVSDAAMTSGSAVLTSATAAFTSADQTKAVLVKGAGASGADLLFKTISTVTDAQTVTLSGTAGTTVTGAVCGIDTMVSTNDGTHPNQPRVAAMAAAIDTSRIVAAYNAATNTGTPLLNLMKLAGTVVRL